jgi:hypothetical protein
MSEDISLSDHESQLNAVEQAAKLYAERGWGLVPLLTRQKGTDIKGWTKGVNQERLEKAFISGHTNLGILTGCISGGLVDIDLDCDEASRLCNTYFPETNAKFGRPSRPLTHCLYIVSEAGRGVKFQDEILLDRQRLAGEEVHATIIEYRANGLQTMVPPSIHPDEEGLQLFWHNATYDPASSTRDDLLASCARLALAVMSERYTIEEIKTQKLAWKRYQEWQILAGRKPYAVYADIDVIESEETNIPFSKPIIDPLSYESPFKQINQLALQDLDSWVPYLGLKICKRKSNGSYSCVAEWRESNTGRKLAERDTNLRITPQGIRDFGRDNPNTKNGGYTPIDLVIAVRNADKPNDAMQWLAERLDEKTKNQSRESLANHEKLLRLDDEGSPDNSLKSNERKTRAQDIGKPKIYISKTNPDESVKAL